MVNNRYAIRIYTPSGSYATGLIPSFDGRFRDFRDSLTDEEEEEESVKAY